MNPQDKQDFLNSELYTLFFEELYDKICPKPYLKCVYEMREINEQH